MIVVRHIITYHISTFSLSICPKTKKNGVERRKKVMLVMCHSGNRVGGQNKRIPKDERNQNKLKMNVGRGERSKKDKEYNNPL